MQNITNPIKQKKLKIDNKHNKKLYPILISRSLLTLNNLSLPKYKLLNKKIPLLLKNSNNLNCRFNNKS